MPVRLHLFCERSVWPEENTFAWFAINDAKRRRNASENNSTEFESISPGSTPSLINLKTFATCPTHFTSWQKLGNSRDKRTPVEPAGMTTRCQIISSVLVGKPAVVNRCVGSVAPNHQSSWELHQLHWCRGALVDFELFPAPALLTTSELHQLRKSTSSRWTSQLVVGELQPKKQWQRWPGYNIVTLRLQFRTEICWQTQIHNFCKNNANMWFSGQKLSPLL